MGRTVNRVKCQVKIGWQTVVGDRVIKLALAGSRGLSVCVGTEEFYGLLISVNVLFIEYLNYIIYIKVYI